MRFGPMLSEMAAYSGWVLLGLALPVILAELTWPRWKVLRQRALTGVAFVLGILILIGLFLMILVGGINASAPNPRNQQASSVESESATGPVIELPDKSTIQLVALSVGPRGTNSWWSPNGKPLSDMNWTETASTVTDWPTSPQETGSYGDYRVLQAVVAVKGGNPPAELLDPFFDGQVGYNTKFRLERNGRDLAGWQGFQKTFPKDATTARLGFTVAAGPFQTESAGTVAHFNEHSMVGELCGEKFNLGKLTQREHNAAITLSLTTQFEPDGSPKYRHRVRVDTSDGKTVVGGIVEGQSTDALVSEVWEFDGVSPKQVKAVHFELRPIYRVEFRNVALWPGMETQVEAVSSSVFGSRTERTLAADKANRDGVVGYRFKDNEVVAVPALLTGHFKDMSQRGFTQELKQWMRDNRVDMLFHFTDKFYDVLTLDMRDGFIAQPKEWDAVRPEQSLPALTKLEELNTEPGSGISGGAGYQDGPTTVNVFRTRDGTTGFYQLRAFSDAQGRGVVIRCKLVQQPLAR
jgi:hypothetical protein